MALTVSGILWVLQFVECNMLSGVKLWPLQFPVHCEYFSLSALVLGISQAWNLQFNCFNIKSVILYIIKLDLTIIYSFTTAFRVLRLKTEERSPIWTVAANIFNKYSKTGDKGSSLSLDLDEFVTTPPYKYLPFYRIFLIPSDMDWNLCTNWVNE